MFFRLQELAFLLKLRYSLGEKAEYFGILVLEYLPLLQSRSLNIFCILLAVLFRFSFSSLVELFSALSLTKVWESERHDIRCISRRRCTA